MAVKAEKKDIVEEIKGSLDSRDEVRTKALVAGLHPSDLAVNLNLLEEFELVRVFRLLEPEPASEVFLELDGRSQKALISAISNTELVKVVDRMETDDATDVISALSKEEARKVLDGINWQEAKVVQKLLKYPEDTAGGKMQAELVSVGQDATVERTIEEVRKRSELIENISNVFVVDGMQESFSILGLNQELTHVKKRSAALTFKKRQDGVCKNRVHLIAPAG